MKRSNAASVALTLFAATCTLELGCSSSGSPIAAIAGDSSGGATNAGAPNGGATGGDVASGGSISGGAAGSLGVSGAPNTRTSDIPTNGWASGVPAISDGKAITYYPAIDNAAMGDYQAPGGGGTYVAQIVPLVTGGYQAALLHAFDVPADVPVAILKGTAANNRVTFTGGGWSATLESGQFTGQNAAEQFSLTYVDHASKTLGAPPPANAVVLFDGTNLDAWAKKDATNWLQAAGPAGWKLVDGGAVEVVPGADGIITQKNFGDYHLHLEYRTIGSPTNSGVLLEGRYESNINEVYGLYDKSPGGGFDNCTPAAAKIKIRAALAPLAWQTLDIDFTAPRFDAANKKIASANATVDLNGVRIYDQMQLDPPTGGAARFGEAPTGPVMLQEHGMALQFRNIWLVESPQ